MNPSKPSFFDKPVSGKYAVKLKLKEGGFGSVYLARDVKNDKKEYAVKFVPEKAARYAEIEKNMYARIAKEQYSHGFVKCYETGVHLNHRYLLMELIGQDLDDMKKRAPGGQFSVKTMLMVGLQVVDRLEALHKIGWVHRDVKPQNLAVGLKEKNKVVYLIDFGLAHKTGSGIIKEEQGKVIGTLGFMSCRAHEGKEQGPADDLQSLIYTLIFFVEGSLPWLKIPVKEPADFHKILLAKRGLNSRNGVKNRDIPVQLFELLKMVRNYTNKDKIDYLQIKYKLLDALKAIGQKNDFVFDWNGDSPRKKSPRKQKEVDSPRKRQQLEKMEQENQQLVQGEIYEVYKFMEGKGQKLQPKKKSPSPKVEKKRISPKKPKKQEPKPVQKARIRPVSAANGAKKQPMNPWDKILAFENSAKVSGPNIVINKTAKHKI